MNSKRILRSISTLSSGHKLKSRNQKLFHSSRMHHNITNNPPPSQKSKIDLIDLDTETENTVLYMIAKDRNQSIVVKHYARLTEHLATRIWQDTTTILSTSGTQTGRLRDLLSEEFRCTNNIETLDKENWIQSLSNLGSLIEPRTAKRILKDVISAPKLIEKVGKVSVFANLQFNFKQGAIFPGTDIDVSGRALENFWHMSFMVFDFSKTLTLNESKYDELANKKDVTSVRTYLPRLLWMSMLHDDMFTKLKLGNVVAGKKTR